MEEEKTKEIIEILQRFIQSYKISCDEQFYQCDAVYEDCVPTMLKLCSMVGYCKCDEDE